jgi:hypothetical protein
MASTYTLNTGIEKPGTGEQSGTWGNTTNTNFDIIDRALSGVGAITLTGTSHTLTTTDGSLTDGMFKVLVLGGSPSGTNTITIGDNTQDKLYFVVNNSGQEVQFSQGTGANATIANGAADIIYADGAGSGAAVASFFGTSLKIGTNLTIGGDSTFNGDTNTFTSANSTDPLLIIKNTTNDANGSRLHFVKDKGAAGADGDDIGTIEFISDDDGQNQTSFAKIVAEVSESANTDEAGKLSFFVAESDGTTTALTAGLVLEGEHATDGEVDVTIGAGAGSLTSFAGDLSLSHDGGIINFGADSDVTLTHVHNAGIKLNDDRILYIGDDQDFQFYHSNSSNLQIIDASARLLIRAPRIDFQNGAGTETTGVVIEDGVFALFHDNTEHFTTTSTGVKVSPDNGTLGFGADEDVKLTHVPDVGLILAAGGQTTSDFGTPANGMKDFVIGGDGNVGMSILVTANNNARLAFGDVDDPDEGQINYDCNTHEMKFVVGGITHFGMGAAGNTGTALNVNILEAPTSLTMADESSFNVTLGHNGILLLNDASTGEGGLFYYQYLSGLTELADPRGATASSDSDGSLCIFKVSTNGNNYTIKNRRGGTKAIGIVSLAHSVG